MQMDYFLLWIHRVLVWKIYHGFYFYQARGSIKIEQQTKYYQGKHMYNIVLRKGKVKTILAPPPQVVEVAFGNEVSAGNGATIVKVPGKGEITCEIADNIFRLLQKERGIPIAFLRRLSPWSQLALYTHMMPLEVVCRGIAAGSYLKRNPTVEEGTIFSVPVVEFFYKDDALGDPLIVIGARGDYWLHDPGQPIDAKAGNRIILGVEDKERWGKEISRSSDRPDRISAIFFNAETIAQRVFAVLRDAFAEQDYTLVDLKIEVGTLPDGRLVLSDAITPDEWRLWKNGDKGQSFDKDPFRKSAEKDGDTIKELIMERYRAVAQVTSKF